MILLLEGQMMSEEDNAPNGDEDFKKFLKETSEGETPVEFLVSVNGRKMGKTITLMKMVQDAYGKLPANDPMRKKLLSLTDKLSRAALAGINFYDLVIFKESERESPDGSS